MHEQLVSLIEQIVRTLADNIAFGYARESDFNVQNDVSLPYILLDPPTATSAFSVNNVYSLSTVWSVSMAFYQKDREDSTGDEYKKILDQMDVYVKRFILALNEQYITLAETGELNTGNIIIQGIGQNPFIKTTSQILTGWLVTFQVVVPDIYEC